MNNKESMDKLQEYYLTQDPATVARCLASLSIDICRMANFDGLPMSESLCLKLRINLMSEEIKDFLKNGHSKKLNIIKMNSGPE